MFCRYFCFFSLCLFLQTQRKCSLGRVSSLGGSDAASLPGFENLTMGYNKYLRPYFGGEPVQIAMSLDVASISSISESDMDYTATIYLRQRWTDPRLVFHGNKSFTLDARLVELLWVPDTYIVESKRSFLHDVTVGNRLIRLFSNGTILYALRITTTVACNMDLSKYPMDTQTCRLQLESWGYDENDVIFTWLRGNDSVHGIEKLRLSQYTVERYYTLISKSQQETGKAVKEKSKKNPKCLPSHLLSLLQTTAVLLRSLKQSLKQNLIVQRDGKKVKSSSLQSGYSVGWKDESFNILHSLNQFSLNSRCFPPQTPELNLQNRLSF